MRFQPSRLAGAAALCFASVGCWQGFAHDEKLDGPFHLVAVDELEQMSLCRALEDGSCVGDGLGDETVFAAGYNDRFIALAIHPRKHWPGPADRTLTEYYYVVRTSSEKTDGGAGAILKGPLSGPQFAKEKRRLSLPEFTKVFDELK
jgi:hypothetical protein